MSQDPKKMILDSLKNCINSELDFLSFCEEFCFHYLYLNEGPFKSSCHPLFESATDFLIYSQPIITPETILSASDLLELIQSTYQQLLKLENFDIQ